MAWRDGPRRLRVLAPALLTLLAWTVGRCFLAPQPQGSSHGAPHRASGDVLVGGLEDFQWQKNREELLARAVSASLATQEGFLRRVASDVASAVSWPYRYWKLAGITKEVAEAAKGRFSARSKEGGGSKGGGAAKTLKAFLPVYLRNHVIARTEPQTYKTLLNNSLDLLISSITAEEPYPFKPYHEAIRGPGLDLYAWGNDFFRAMVKFRSSRVEGLENVKKIESILEAGGNVVLLANHQTEADPQVLSILLERCGHGSLAEKSIFVAGHKVTTDPLAIPFSMGRNLLTIFSKKYLNTFSEEEREVKSARNQETVGEMQRLMKEGGHLFWVAPSGGRDRRSKESGRFEPAAFDPQSVGLFLLLAQKAASKGEGAKTHFFPLAMWSHKLVPPPEDAKAGVGEERSASRAPIAIEFGAELDPEALGGRKLFPAAAEKQVRALYDHLDSLLK